MRKRNIFFGIVLAFSLTACYELDKQPQGQLASSTAFGSTSEISKYLNQFYQDAVRTHPGQVDGGGIAFGDNASDNMIPNSVNTRLAGEGTLSGAQSLGGYRNIRNLNFLLKNIGNCKETGKAFNQCLGEAYYFRAWYYYQMFVNYGELTWVNEVLDPVQEQMERPRDGRTVIADSILADLDKAIYYLNEESSNASRRVHRDVARALKSEVALFEGTWEKYHREKGTRFYDKTITDEKITDYLTQAATAAKAVMDRGVWGIFMGNDPLTAYRDLFITLDLTNNNEVLWWKAYNAMDNIGHSVTRYLNKGGGLTGVSLSLIDDYLTKEGKPFIGEARDKAQQTYGEELKPTLRDPRLSQTVCLPGQELRPNKGYTYTFPPLNGDSYNQNTTGYSLLKYIEFNTSNEATLDGEHKSQAPAIQYRYADILLNYAEALAELNGEENAEKIKEAIHLLRKRVGMPDVDFEREYNTNDNYPFRHLNKFVQAVRRERRVEKACEGRRLTDIMRWAAADELIVGTTPLGALFVGSNLEQAYNGELKYDQPADNNLFLTGNPQDQKRHIIPFNNKNYPNGWQFKTDRDYLLPIQPRMLSLTRNQWKQNPGW